MNEYFFIWEHIIYKSVRPSHPPQHPWSVTPAAFIRNAQIFLARFFFTATIERTFIFENAARGQSEKAKCNENMATRPQPGCRCDGTGMWVCQDVREEVVVRDAPASSRWSEGEKDGRDFPAQASGRVLVLLYAWCSVIKNFEWIYWISWSFTE